MQAKTLHRKTGHSRKSSVTLCDDSAPSSLRAKASFASMGQGELCGAIKRQKFKEKESRTVLCFDSQTHKAGKEFTEIKISGKKDNSMIVISLKCLCFLIIVQSVRWCQ